MPGSTDAYGQKQKAAIAAARPRCQRAEPHDVIERHLVACPDVLAGANVDDPIATNYQPFQRALTCSRFPDIDSEAMIVL
jgi:hypothetical protein